MPSDRPSWLIRRFHAFTDAGRGLSHLILSEPPVWIHLAATVITVSLAIWLRVSPVEWAILTLTAAAVWTAEAFNTSIEKLCDALHPELDPKIGLVKDLAASAVLISAIAAMAVAAFIFGPRIYVLLQVN